MVIIDALFEEEREGKKKRFNGPNVIFYWKCIFSLNCSRFSPFSSMSTLFQCCLLMSPIISMWVIGSVQCSTSDADIPLIWLFYLRCDPLFCWLFSTVTELRLVLNWVSAYSCNVICVMVAVSLSPQTLTHRFCCWQWVTQVRRTPDPVTLIFVYTQICSPERTWCKYFNCPAYHVQSSYAEDLKGRICSDINSRLFII